MWKFVNDDWRFIPIEDSSKKEEKPIKRKKRGKIDA